MEPDIDSIEEVMFERFEEVFWSFPEPNEVWGETLSDFFNDLYHWDPDFMHSNMEACIRSFWKEKTGTPY